MNSSLTRREALARALAAISTLALPFPGCSSRPAAAQLLGLLFEEIALPQPLAIGKAWIEASNGDDRMRAALDTVSTLPLKDGAKEIQGAFAQRLVDDFSEGRVVWLEGWLVSETEADLCALLAANAQLLGSAAGS